jgi:outer membrane lipoprotein-sorting protein
LRDEDADLKEIFRQSRRPFGSVDVDAVIRQAATGADATAIHEKRPTALVGGLRSATLRRTTMLRTVGAICACAASVCLALVFGPWGSGTVLGQVQDALKKVRTASYTVTNAIEGQPAMIWKVKLMGGHSCRVEQPGGVYLVFDVKGKKIMEVNPCESKVRITENLPVPDSYNVLAQLSNLEASAVKDRSRLPNREIGGTQATGFVVETHGDRLNVWVDPATNLPLLIERLYGNSSAAEQWTEFRFNESLDASQFSMEIPAGFVVESRRAVQPDGASRSTTSEPPTSTRVKTESYGFGPEVTPKSR